jgi:hypothetical protein
MKIICALVLGSVVVAAALPAEVPVSWPVSFGRR